MTPLNIAATITAGPQKKLYEDSLVSFDTFNAYILAAENVYNPDDEITEEDRINIKKVSN